jgi:protein-tyrosine-phosphatase
MAEALFKKILADTDVLDEWRVESAGTWAIAGEPATHFARQVMQERGLEIDNHQSKPVSGDLLHAFDLVLVMEKRHSDFIRDHFAEYGDRVHMLSAMTGSDLDVDDPVWGTLDTYRQTVDELVDLMERGYERILELVDRGGETT